MSDTKFVSLAFILYHFQHPRFIFSLEQVIFVRISPIFYDFSPISYVFFIINSLKMSKFSGLNIGIYVKLQYPCTNVIPDQS